MSNIATALKAEISRVARKEMTAELKPLKAANSKYRRDIAALKKRLISIEKGLRVRKNAAQPAPVTVSHPTLLGSFRFTPKSLAAQRQRLHLSTAELARLLNVSDQSIYKWEQGTSVPRQRSLAAINHLKNLTKKTARAVLDSL